MEKWQQKSAHGKPACKRSSDVLRLSVSILALIFSTSIALADQCDSGRIALRGDWGQAAFNVEIADTAELRSKGLMHREEMARQDGMLFIFDAPRHATFWMRNTLIPLDMLFAGNDGVVTTFHSNAIPHDETLIPGGDDIMYVLEINGGLSELYGIGVGTEFKHNSIPADLASWPCLAE